jgi:hypothetical protein
MANAVEYFSTIAIVIMQIESPARIENKVVTLSLIDEKKLTFGKIVTPKNVYPRKRIKNDAENSIILRMESFINSYIKVSF